MRGRFVPEQIVDRLLAMNVFAGINRAARDRLIESIFYARIPEGTEFIKQGAPAEACYFLLDGEIAVKNGSDLLALMKGPTLIGLLALIDQQERSASVATFVDSDVVMIPKEAFDELMERSTVFAHNVIRHLTQKVRALHRADATARTHFDDHFDSPYARLLQGPYTFNNAHMYALVVQTTKERLRDVCPPDVLPLPGVKGRYLLTFNRFPEVVSKHPSAEGRVFSYSECTPFVPVLGPGRRPAVFSPELYLDNFMALALGREMYGFPKRYGKVDICDRYIDLAVDNKMRLRATWDGSTPVEAPVLLASLTRDLFDSPMAAKLKPMVAGIWDTANQPTVRRFWPAIPVLLHNMVPDAFERSGDRMRIDEVVEVPFCLHEVGGFRRLDNCAGRGFSDWALAGEVVSGYRLDISMTFGRARRPHDYHRPPAGPRESLRHALSPWINSITDMLTTY